MRKRKKMSRKHSRKNFAKGTKIKARNNSGNPMRGGIRA